jgi:hypothetical protein
LKKADAWSERVAAMPSDELAAVLTIDSARYPGEVLEASRLELRRRGFIFRGNGEDGIVTSDGLRLAPRPSAPAAELYQGPNGVGGWLLVFVLSLLVCRPLSILQNGLGADPSVIMRVGEKFPATALLLNFDKVLAFGLLVYGVVVAFALFNKGSALSVKLVRIFLIANPLAHVLVALLCGLSDFPEEYRNQLAQEVMGKAVMASFWSLLWILYFNRSRRVKATYLTDEYP